MKKIIVFFALVLLAATAFAQKESDFTINAEGIITAFNGFDTEIVIPARIGNRQVTGIAGSVFERSGITALTLPQGIRTIDGGAFSGNELTTLTIGNGVSIGTFSSKFFGDTSIDSSTVITLGANCTFGSRPFRESLYFDYHCNGRKAGTYTVREGYPRKKEGDFTFVETQYGALITEASNALPAALRIPAELGGTAVRGIGDGAFRYKRISRMQLPEGLVFIDNQAFEQNGLTALTIPNSVAYIGDKAFSANRIAGALTIPNGVTYIGDYAFADYNQLTSVTIGNGVISIGVGAFRGNALTSVTIPNSITSIGDLVFQSNKLTSVTIPNSVTSIGSLAFQSNQLTSVTIPNSVTFIGSGAFSDNKLASVTIPNSVTTIRDRAFLQNPLTSITIGANVRLGGNYVDSFDYSFDGFYSNSGRAAGRYVVNPNTHRWARG